MENATALKTPASDRVVTTKDNSPPEEIVDPIVLHANHIDNLVLETGNWADGKDIQNEAEAAEVERLLGLLSEAIEEAEAERDEQIAPLTTQVTTIREAWYPLIGETKKITGSAIRAKKVLLEVKTKWGNQVTARAAAEAARLRQKAAEEAAAAREAAQAASGNLEATAQAEDLIRQAQTTLRSSNAVASTHIKGMRDNWVVVGLLPEVEDGDRKISGSTALLRHYTSTNPDRVREALLEMARQDVRDGKRSLPGLIIENQRRAVS